jgi:hypothetical protein
MILSISILIPVLVFFYKTFGNILYPFLNFVGTSSGVSLPESAAYDPNLLFFIQKLPLFIGLNSLLVLGIIALGILIYWTFKLKKSKNTRLNQFKSHIYKKNVHLNLILIIIVLLTFIFSFGHIFYMLSEILFFILAYLFYNLTKNIKNMDSHLLFLAWFMAFFIFHSVFIIKDNRYFITMAPSVAYFLILGLSEISKVLQFKIKNHNSTFPILAIIFTVLIVLSTASYLPVIQQANEDNKVTNERIAEASQWFVQYDPDYKNKVLYSDLWPTFSWYLKTNVTPMPVFKDNNTYYGGVKEFNITPQDNIEYNKELDNNKADYYFCIRQGLNLTSYQPVKRIGSLTIYKRK